MAITAGLMKRFAACLYELLSLLAICLLCTAVFILLFDAADSGLKRLGLQVLLWLVIGAYFVRCWMKTGQTLATQAWKLKLVNKENETLNFTQAVQRYGFTTLSIGCFGLGFLWAIIDKNHLFLHDRVLNMHWVSVT